MHELSVVEALIDMVSEQIRQPELEAVKQVEVAIGSLSCIEKSALEFCFEQAKKDTSLEHALLICHDIEAVARCRNCQHRFPTENYHDTCPKCQHYGIDLIEGDDLRLLKIDIIPKEEITHV